MVGKGQLSQYKANKTNLLIIFRPSQGKVIKFVNGLYSTSKKPEKKFLEGLKCFGKMDKDVIITRIQ